MFELSLSTVEALCNLAGVVLELLLHETCVPLEVSVSTYLALLHDVLEHRLVFVETWPSACFSL